MQVTPYEGLVNPLVIKNLVIGASMKPHNITVAEIKLTAFSLIGLQLGEHGRGRVLTLVPVEEAPFYELGQTRTGKPKLIPSNNVGEGWIARISTEGCYTRDTHGRASATPGVVVIAKGSGAYGDAGRIGSWDDFLLFVPDGGVVKVQPSGGMSKRPPYFLHFKLDGVVKILAAEWDAYLEKSGIQEEERSWLS